MTKMLNTVSMSEAVFLEQTQSIALNNNHFNQNFACKKKRLWLANKDICITKIFKQSSLLIDSCMLKRYQQLSD